MKSTLQRLISSLTSSTFTSSSQKMRLLVFFTFSSCAAFSQSISPATINISGHSSSYGNYQFEWSVGESSSIIAMTSSNLVVTSGVLQSFAAYQPELTNVSTWQPGEIRIYPVPTRDVIEINMLHKMAGKTKIELFDLMGKKVMEKEFEYFGVGAVEKWNLGKVPSGQYFINIQLISTQSGKPIKKGAFKILKIQ